ncbi:glycosyltransferase [Candidatus Peregrinibacteria bacterium]|nr:glycosyltransferase [Candidatus Peregrinibacteria bacterium]
MRLAIVADWLTVFAGAEQVIAQFHELWPQAPIITTVTRRETIGALREADIRTTPLQHWYRLVHRHQLLLPWMPRAIESIDLSPYDTILSSSHAVAKGIVPRSGSVHLCYCHTPMRYAWSMEEQYLSDFRVPRMLRGFIRRRLKRLRRWDLSTAKRVDRFIANSSGTQKRIADVYGRESSMIPPPVGERFFGNALVGMTQRRSFLAVGRLVPYKRFDLLIALANDRKLPLTIVGRGQEEERLRRMAGPTVALRGYVPDHDLPSLYGEAKAVLFPQHEDAGIVPLEAQASGTPVIAYGEGGVRDTVLEGRTGVFFGQQTAASLSEAIDRFSSMIFDPLAIRKNAEQFSSSRFRNRIAAEVEKTREEFLGG